MFRRRVRLPTKSKQECKYACRAQQRACKNGIDAHALREPALFFSILEFANCESEERLGGEGTRRGPGYRSAARRVAIFVATAAIATGQLFSLFADETKLAQSLRVARAPKKRSTTVLRAEPTPLGIVNRDAARPSRGEFQSNAGLVVAAKELCKLALVFRVVRLAFTHRGVQRAGRGRRRPRAIFHRGAEYARKIDMQLEQDVLERFPATPAVGVGGPLVDSGAAPSVVKAALPRDAPAVRRVLVCIDHSKFSEACVRYGVEISKSLGGTITLLHVMQPPHERAGVQALDVLDWEISRQEADAFLGRLEHEASKAVGQHVETRLEQGHPAERITAVARELDADIIILGSQGERSVAPRNLGSTALQVLAVAHSSVLVVGSSTATTGVVRPKRILVPLDGSVRAESILPTVMRIASMHGAELLLTLDIQEPIVTGVLCSAEDLAAARDLASRLEISGKRYLEELRARMVREGAAARTLVLRSADERHSLLELSRSEQSDLIVLSAHGSNCNPEVVCGSVTASLLTHSLAPVLVLQDLRDTQLHGQESNRRAPPLRASCPPVGG